MTANGKVPDYDEDWLEVAFQLEGVAEAIREAVESAYQTKRRLRLSMDDPRARALLTAAWAFTENSDEVKARRR